ncbi:hypothetical protein AVEN_213489-1 [Araneus ventricosus]|uniref:Uncharacterized protein n=1 Tax=Araneus ventricosus TaxID=182803 RepID=A0A4Y2NP30_ARAVE|nr:hypothetical protein AVEN_213489-1 [Araneus ventricosus]
MIFPFSPEFQFKNTFDPALRGVVEKVKFLVICRGMKQFPPMTNLCPLSRIAIGISHNVMRFFLDDLTTVSQRGVSTSPSGDVIRISYYDAGSLSSGAFS